MRNFLLLLLTLMATYRLQAQAHISIDSATYNFGSVHRKAMVEHTFRLRNTGNEPLVIQSVEPACGCVTVNYSRQPIAPGAEAEITLRFLPKGKKGFQLRSAEVQSNADNATVQLYLKGEVLQ